MDVATEYCDRVYIESSKRIMLADFFLGIRSEFPTPASKTLSIAEIENGIVLGTGAVAHHFRRRFFLVVMPYLCCL